MAGRYIIEKRGSKEQHTQKIETVPAKLEIEGYKATKEIKILPNRNSVIGTHHITIWYQTKQRKNTQSTN